MCAAGNISFLTSCTKVIPIVLVFAASITCHAELSASLTSSDTKSPGRNLHTSNRHRRAPGWGKRAPGWGKRLSPNEELLEDFDNIPDILNRVADLRSAVSGNSLSDGNSDLDKRASGWGKQFFSEDLYPNIWASEQAHLIPQWGQQSSNIDNTDEFVEMDKRAPGWGKRAPGWGKRAPGWGKRAPGWGKRSFQIDLDTDGVQSDTGYDDWNINNSVDEEILDNSGNAQDLTNGNAALRTGTLLSGEVLQVAKRAPGWGKRAPGWGKRDYQFDLNDEDVLTGKRAPGWGKRAPGWGKRAPGWGKRAPGWGKRAPGWGKRDYETLHDGLEVDKRAPGWGKRSAERVKRALKPTRLSAQNSCRELHDSEKEYITRITELASQRSSKGGGRSIINASQRK